MGNFLLRSFFSLMVVLALGACGDDGTVTPDPPDALADAPAGDADPGDADPGDADPGDASRPDATRPDATRPDASVPDASVPDASVPDASVPDAMVADRPTCQNVGARTEGWYAPDGTLICIARCAGAVAACEAAGRSEGWYADMDGKGCPSAGPPRLIQYVPPPGCRMM
jgi:hypothetical protein